MSMMRLDDLDAIRRPTPALDRAWVIGLSLIALGGFASGFVQQVIGPIGVQTPAETDVSPVPVATALPPAEAPPPSIKPAMQVATSPPEPAPPPRLEVPDPVTPGPAAPTVAPTVEAPSLEAPPAPAAEPAAPVPTEPPADAEEPPAA